MNTDSNEIQKRSEALGVPSAVTRNGATYFIAGLCPRCKQPIQICVTNGGKLHPARTLRVDHAFSGNVRCEDTKVNEQLQTMSGQEKSDFFAMRHDLEVMASMGDDFRRETVQRIWPNPPPAVVTAIKRLGLWPEVEVQNAA